MSRIPKYLVALFVALALLAGACSNSDDDSETTTESTPQATEEAAEEEPTEAAADDAAEEEATAESVEEEATEEATEEPADSERDSFVALPDVPGVTDEEIRFASIALKEGNPLGTDIKDAYNEGIKAYFDWRNSEGGIFGRELVLAQEIDDEMGMNQQKSQEVIAADNAFAVFSATLIPSGWEDLEEAGFPTFAWGIHADPAAGKEYIFGHNAVACADCPARAVPWMARDAGATRAASLGYGISENSRVCANTQKDAFETYQEDTGVEVVYLNDNLAFGLSNGIAVEVTEMKDLEVDFITTCMDLNGMRTLADELARQGMEEVVLHHPNTYNQEFVAEAGGVFDGDYVVPQFTPFESDVNLEMFDRYFDYMDARGVTPSELAMIGWINADQAFQGLLAAGPEFSRQAVADASNAMTAYDAGGLINPIDWTRQKEPPTREDPSTHGYVLECFTPVLVVDGAFVTVADPGTPWFCWDNSSKAWAEPEQVAFGDQ